MSEQKMLTATEHYIELDQYLLENGLKRVLLVCDNSIQYLKINHYFNEVTKRIGVEVVLFDDFHPNPSYESIVKGVALFNSTMCEGIIAVGGGSAIDVAKCIKLYSNMDNKVNYLKQTIIPNDIKFMAIPTTAGTGSEATKYAVIYYKGEKQSITDNSCLPSTVLMDSSTLKTLSSYQKKCTMLDALSHALESFWSVNSTEESKKYSRTALQLIVDNMDGYLKNEDKANANMLIAANIAGRAINITQTTAGHAMCYKLTTLYGIAHGHAAALCNRKLFPWMIHHIDKCIDIRGTDYLKNVFQQIAESLGCTDADSVCIMLEQLYQKLELAIPQAGPEDYGILKESVNPIRLKNHPVQLDEESIVHLYHEILQSSGDKHESRKFNKNN